MSASLVLDFEQDGFVRIPRGFPADRAEAMESRIWAFLHEKYGMARDEPGSWNADLHLQLQAMKHDDVFADIGSAILTDALDELLGAGTWARPAQWGQFLVSVPKPSQRWQVPGALWHTDFPFDDANLPPRGALVFSYISRVPAHGGGTSAIRGSHHFVARVVASLSAERRAAMKHVRSAYLRHNPWMAALDAEPRTAEQAALIAEPWREDGLHLEIVELTGEPGDVIIGHPWLLHCPAPNTGSRVKMMRVQRVRCH